MARTQARARITLDVRRDLWVVAGGRCEFKGCCKPLNRDILTKKVYFIGEHAHIIGDSPDAARGVVGESELLAKDPSNIMLLCYDCHKRVDHKGKANPYSADQLRAMKREHESRIEKIYSATGAKESLPVLMAFPVGSHVPIIDIAQIRHALVENSQHTRFPGDQYIHIDRADFDFQDSSDDFWPLAEASLRKYYETRIHPEIVRNGALSHLTIAGFAPIPMLMKLGALIGDKTEASVLDLPGERWLWDMRADCPAPQFTFKVPENLPREVAAVINISGTAIHPAGIQVVEFRAVEPNRGIIRRDQHLQDFRRQFNAFLGELVRAGVKVLHLHPATPLSASIEIGRSLLPKVLEEVHVWDWQAPTWRPTLRLK